MTDIAGSGCKTEQTKGETEVENNKIRVTVSLFFKIKDADIFGGAGSIGYSESKIDLNTADLSGFKLQEYAKGQIESFAELLKASEENIQIVSRQEYEDNTDGD